MRSTLGDIDWNPRLDLELLYTPLDRCQPVPLGPVDQRTVTALEAERFDQAPVLGGPRGVLGIVRTKDLKALASSGQALSAESPRIDPTQVEPSLFLADLLARLDTRHAVLVATGDRVDGLLSSSDLNKHAFRVALYMVFAALEIALAEVIRARCPDHTEWIGHLKEYDQVQVLGSWEVAKRKSVDTGILSACTLTQLVRIVQGSHRLADPLCGGMKKAKALNALPNWRNKVMHPVKLLVSKPEDVGEIRKAVERVRDLGTRLEPMRRLADRTA